MSAKLTAAGHNGVDGVIVQNRVDQVDQDPGVEHVLTPFLSLEERSVLELILRLKSVSSKFALR